MKTGSTLVILLLLLLGTSISHGFAVNPSRLALATKHARQKLSPSSARSWLAVEPTSIPSSDDPQKKNKKKKSRIITLWIHVISIFIIANYRSVRGWPAGLTRIPLAVWSLVHAVSGMLFAGTIVVTTILEWLVVSHQQPPVSQFWFGTIMPAMEQAVVLPALTGSILSGVAQAFHNYSSLRGAPRHVKSSLHLLFLFGIWWGVTDRRTQHPAQQEAAADGRVVPRVWKLRRVSNLVSCGFLLALYAVMVLKPGYIQ